MTKTVTEGEAVLETALVLTGIPDDTNIRARISRAGGLEVIWPGTAVFINELRAAIRDVRELGLPMPSNLTLQVPRVPLFNHLADPDRYGLALRAGVEVVRTIGTPCFNHPSAVLRSGRDGVADALQGLDGLVVPRTIRLNPKRPADIHRAVTEHGMRYPVIMRVTGTQTRQTQVLIATADDDAAVNSVPWGGKSVYLTQYVDYADADGWFRKARILWVGDYVAPRHHMSSREWAVGGSVASATQDAFEEAWLRGFEEHVLPRCAPLFASIRKRLGLDLFAMDCSFLPDGRILLFEATASVSLFDHGARPEVPPEVTRRLVVHNQEFQKLVHAPSRWLHGGG